jgi:Tfp pilus assembly protein PilX
VDALFDAYQRINSEDLAERKRATDAVKEIWSAGAAPTGTVIKILGRKNSETHEGWVMEKTGQDAWASTALGHGYFFDATVQEDVDRFGYEKIWG